MGTGDLGMFLSPNEKGEYFYGSGQDAVNWGWQLSGNYDCNIPTGCNIGIPITANCDIFTRCLLDSRLDKAILFYSSIYGIPPDLLAATQLAEVVTDWQPYHPAKDWVLSVAASNAGNPLANAILNFAETHTPGPHEIHLETARRVEGYFQRTYPNTPMASLLTSAPTTSSLILALLSSDGNIRYSSAILRELADERKGSRVPHLSDLTVTDKEIIYGAYRTGFGSYGDLRIYQAAKIPGESGQKITFALILYRNYYR